MAAVVVGSGVSGCGCWRWLLWLGSKFSCAVTSNNIDDNNNENNNNIPGAVVVVLLLVVLILRAVVRC